MKVFSPGGKDAPLKAASIVKYSGLLSICNLERVFLVSVYAFDVVKLLKVFLFYKCFVTRNIETLHLNHVFCKCHTVKMYDLVLVYSVIDTKINSYIENHGLYALKFKRNNCISVGL